MEFEGACIYLMYYFTKDYVWVGWEGDGFLFFFVFGITEPSIGVRLGGVVVWSL